MENKDVVEQSLNHERQSTSGTRDVEKFSLQWTKPEGRVGRVAGTSHASHLGSRGDKNIGTLGKRQFL